MPERDCFFARKEAKVGSILKKDAKRRGTSPRLLIGIGKK
jgi:hypothetical protein